MSYKNIITLLFCVLVEITLITLSIWQWQRLAWKQTLLAGLQEKVNLPPASLSTLFVRFKGNQEALQMPPTLRPLFEDEEFRPIHVAGKFMEHSLAYQIRSENGLLGMDIAAPIITPENEKIVVILGHIPFKAGQTAEEALTDFTQKTDFTKIYTITGLVRLPRFQDEQASPPVSQKALVAGFTLKYFGYTDNLLPLIIKSQRINPALPLIQDTSSKDIIASIPNNHFIYMLTWASLAILFPILCLIFGNKIRKKY